MFDVALAFMISCEGEYWTLRRCRLSNVKPIFFIASFKVVITLMRAPFLWAIVISMYSKWKVRSIIQGANGSQTPSHVTSDFAEGQHH